jgi:hypothetical protein
MFLMAEQSTTVQQPQLTPADQPQPDHVVLQSLAQTIRDAGVVDNQTSRMVQLSEADAKELTATLEQMAQRLEMLQPVLGTDRTRTGATGAKP